LQLHPFPIGSDYENQQDLTLPELELTILQLPSLNV